MDPEFLAEYRARHQRRLAELKAKEKREEEKKLLDDIGITNSDFILDSKFIDQIQKFFRKYRFEDKICINLHNFINYDQKDIIKFRHGLYVYGFHYMQLDYHFNNVGYSNPYNEYPLELYQIRRINSILRKKNKNRFISHSEFHNFNTVNFNQSDCWNPAEIYGLFESRGINSVEVPENVFNEMLELDPSLYAVEIITENNHNRSYAAFDNFPSQSSVQMPIGIYSQLKIMPKDCDSFKMRIIEPPKGERIKLRCMITNDQLLEDVKGKLTSEIEKHKILSKNQIIIVESDINYGMIPFRIEELEPSNVIGISDVDIEVDFLDSLPYEDPMEALLIELNK